MRKLFTVDIWNPNLFSYQQPLVSSTQYGFWTMEQIEKMFESSLELDKTTWELKYKDKTIARCTLAEVETILEEIADQKDVSDEDIKESIRKHGVQSEFLVDLPDNKRKFVVAPYDTSIETTDSSNLINIFTTLDYVMFDYMKLLVFCIKQRTN